MFDGMEKVDFSLAGEGWISVPGKNIEKPADHVHWPCLSIAWEDRSNQLQVLKK